MKYESFSQLVKSSWSSAVNVASNEMNHYRPEVIKALSSPDPEERSAAVASLNEANDVGAHDDIISLLDDPDKTVRMEVAEYLEELGVPEDIEMILERIERYPDIRFSLSKSLCTMTGRVSGMIDNGDTPDVVENTILEWKTYLTKKGYLKGSR